MPHALQQQVAKLSTRYHPLVLFITNGQRAHGFLTLPKPEVKSPRQRLVQIRGRQQHVAAARVPDLEVHVPSLNLIHTLDISDNGQPAEVFALGIWLWDTPNQPQKPGSTAVTGHAPPAGVKLVAASVEPVRAGPRNPG